MGWYKKSAKRNIRNTFCSYGGIRFSIEITGEFRPANINEPAEYPDIKIIDARIEDANELWEYTEWISKDFDERVQESIRSMSSHFGANFNDPLFIVVNGIKFIIKTPSMEPSSWDILEAEMVDVDEFLKNLSVHFQEACENKVWRE